MYGSRRLTYHQGDRSTSVKEQVEASKKVEVDPSTAFWGMPFSTTEDCMGALPAATFRTETGMEEKEKKIKRGLRSTMLKFRKRRMEKI